MSAGRRPPAAPGLPEDPGLTDLIWVQTGFIGDVLLTTAAIGLAGRALPGVRQHAVTTPVGAQVLAGCPALATVLVFDKARGGALSFRATRQALRAALPPAARPVVLAPHRSYRSSFLCRYLGLPTVAYAEAGASWLAAVTVPRVAPLHEAARIGLLLEPLGVARAEIVAARPLLAPLPLLHPGAGPAAEPASWPARLAAHRGPVVGVAPGSVWGTKRWPAERYAELVCALLAEAPDALVVLLGSAGERPVADALERGLGASPRVVDLVGRTGLADLRRIVPRLAMLVANDSSPVHYASAFGIPTVALFGATVPQMGFGPLAPGSVALGIQLSCRPCSDHGPQTCPLGHFRCMRELSVETVHAACRQVLAATGASRAGR